MKILFAASSPPLGHLIKRSLGRFNYDWTEVDNGFDAFQKILSDKFDLILLEYDLPRMNAAEILERAASLENFKQPPVMVLTSTEIQRQRIEVGRFPKTEVAAGPIAVREFVARIQNILHLETRAVCMGGGTGLFTVLSGLKTLAGIHPVAVVSMSDDGGSTGKLRDLFGILPPGDIRRSLVALSTAPDLLNELMQYRFERGGEFKGHNLGNLLLTALCQMRGSMRQAVKSIGEILKIQGEVIPVTDTVNTLKAELENGNIVEGETHIDLMEGLTPDHRIKRLWQEPPVVANEDALEAIANARYLILGPGDLFTSVISNLIVGGIPEAIRATRAKKIYICNIMTEPGETTGFQVSDHIREINKYLGQDILDYVLCSSTAYTEAALKTYAKLNQFPVTEKNPEAIRQITRARLIWADVASEHELVRHDSLKLAAELKKIMDEK